MSASLNTTTEPQTLVAPPEPDCAPPTDGAALRAELAELLERNLLRRFTSAGPRDRVLISTIAGLTADLAHLTKLLRPGCDPRVPPLLLGGITRVASRLNAFGTRRIAGTGAELILQNAIEVEGLARTLMPAAGNA